MKSYDLLQNEDIVIGLVFRYVKLNKYCLILDIYRQLESCPLNSICCIFNIRIAKVVKHRLPFLDWLFVSPLTFFQISMNLHLWIWIKFMLIYKSSRLNTIENVVNFVTFINIYFWFSRYACGYCAFISNKDNLPQTNFSR